MTPTTAMQLLGPSTGGIRVHVAALASGLTDRGLRAPVVGPAGVLEGLGPQAGVVAVPAGVSPVGLLRARRELSPFGAASEVIHAHGLKAAWTAVGSRPRRPVVLTVHNVVLGGNDPRTLVQRRLEQRILRRVDRVVALTTTMASQLEPVVGRERLRVVLPASPPPVVTVERAKFRAELGVGDDAPLVVCVARLHPQKDIPTLLRAWRRVHGSRPDAVLAIVGDGPLREQVASSINQLGLGSSVILTGQLDNGVDPIAAADLAVMTSIWEGASIAFADCTQLGIPLVSTPVGLAPDLLDGESGGVLVPIGDDAAVATALLDLLDDPVRARQLGERGRERAREVFDPARSIDAIVGIYHEVMQ